MGIEIRLTYHASRALDALGLAREDVVYVIEHPESILVGTTADEYDATVRGTLYRVVVVKGSEPPLIITVHEVRP